MRKLPKRLPPNAPHVLPRLPELNIAKEPISLETPIGDEEDAHLGDFIEDKNAILPLDSAIQSDLRDTTTRALASLNHYWRRRGRQ